MAQSDGEVVISSDDDIQVIDLTRSSEDDEEDYSSSDEEEEKGLGLGDQQEGKGRNDGLEFNTFTTESCFDSWRRRNLSQKSSPPPNDHCQTKKKSKSLPNYPEVAVKKRLDDDRLPERTCTILHEEIQSLYQVLAPNRRDHFCRSDLFRRISKIIKSLWPYAEVQLFGSSAVDLYLPCSDVDLVVKNVDPTKNNMYSLARRLKPSGLVKNTVVITGAKVPLVKCVSTMDSEIGIDISFSHFTGVDMISQIHTYTKMYSNVLEPLLFFLKLYLLRRNLNEPFSGGLSSFGTLLFLVSFFQQYRNFRNWSPDNPPDITTASLGSLLVDFLDLYGRKFNYHTTGISTWGDGFYFPRPTTVTAKSPDNPYILDPLDSDNNVTRSTTQIDLIRSEFAESYFDLIQLRKGKKGAGSSPTRDHIRYVLRSKILLLGHLPKDGDLNRDLIFFHSSIKQTTPILLPDFSSLTTKKDVKRKRGSQQQQQQVAQKRRKFSSTPPPSRPPPPQFKKQKFEERKQQQQAKKTRFFQKKSK